MTELAIAIAVVLVSYLTQGNIGLSLGDEGFLWDGVTRVKQRQIPTRDFKAYDPGRYYWCFVGSKIFGDGIMGIRRSVTVFQIIGLWAGLLSLSRTTDNVWTLLGAAILFVVWMQPRHKLFEHTTSLVAVYVGTVLIESPTLLHYFIAGVFVGAAAIVGRNHGLYCFAAFAILVLLAWMKGKSAFLLLGYLYWGSGILVGYLPVLTMWIFVPRMFDSYWYNNIVGIFRRGTTNLRVPVPLPWSADFSGQQWSALTSKLLLGAHFIVLPLFALSALVWVLADYNSCNYPPIVAGAVVGTFYLHLAFSRADLPHLCQSIPPLLVVVLAIDFVIQSQVISVTLLAVLLVIAVQTVRPIMPLLVRLDNYKSYVTYDVNGEKLRLPVDQCRFLDAVRSLIANTVSPDEQIFIAPFFPALYPFLQIACPVWNDYFLFSETRDDAAKIIADLENNRVTWALIGDQTIDDNDKYRFRNNYPVVFTYIQEHFHSLPAQGLGREWAFLKRSKFAQ